MIWNNFLFSVKKTLLAIKKFVNTWSHVFIISIRSLLSSKNLQKRLSEIGSHFFRVKKFRKTLFPHSLSKLFVMSKALSCQFCHFHRFSNLLLLTSICLPLLKIPAIVIVPFKLIFFLPLFFIQTFFSFSSFVAYDCVSNCH